MQRPKKITYDDCVHRANLGEGVAALTILALIVSSFFGGLKPLQASSDVRYMLKKLFVIHEQKRGRFTQ